MRLFVYGCYFDFSEESLITLQCTIEITSEKMSEILSDYFYSISLCTCKIGLH